MHINIL